MDVVMLKLSYFSQEFKDNDISGSLVFVNFAASLNKHRNHYMHVKKT
jgi:hypothetical protein